MDSKFTSNLNAAILKDQRTAAAIAAAAGIGASYLSQMRKGGKTAPSMAVVIRLAQVLDVPVEKLTGGEDSEFTDGESSRALDQGVGHTGAPMDQMVVVQNPVSPPLLKPEVELFLEMANFRGRQWTLNKLSDWLEKGQKDPAFLLARLTMMQLAISQLKRDEPTKPHTLKTNPEAKS